MDQRVMARRQAVKPVNPAIGPRVAGPSQARLEALSESVNNGPTVQRTAAIAGSLVRRAPDLAQGVVQRQFDSIREARDMAGDPQGDATRRVQAEVHLRQTDAMAEAAIRALVQKGDFHQALGRAAVLAGLSPGSYDIRPTADYRQVVGEADIPRGTPSGVTVIKGGSPVIYIHEQNIRNWVGNGDVGDLLSTIRHEATHVDQDLRPGNRQGDDEREFEAYANEIVNARKLFDSGEDSLAPSSAHLAESYAKALKHYANIPEPVSEPLLGIKQKIDALYQPGDGQAPAGLRRYLELNDRSSGRVDRIANATRNVLKAYIKNPELKYPDHAYNEYVKIPEQFRSTMDKEFDELFEKAHDIMTQKHKNSRSLSMKSIV